MNQTKVDEYIFIVILFFGLILAIEGKAIASFIFNGFGEVIREWHVTPYVLCAFLASFFQYVRSKPWSIKTKMLITPITGGIVVILIHTTSSSPSVLVFAIQLLLVVFSVSVIALEPTVQRKDLDKEFWKLILESAMKSIRYILMIYVAGFALLKFLSDGVGESKAGFITSFAYPTVMVVYGVFIIGYWLAIPAWENLVESHKRQPDKKHNKAFKRN